MKNIIELKNVTKKFGGITALNSASLTVEEGEVVLFAEGGKALPPRRDRGATTRLQEESGQGVQEAGEGARQLLRHHAQSKMYRCERWQLWS